jgi:hypothetical protein
MRFSPLAKKLPKCEFRATYDCAPGPLATTLCEFRQRSAMPWLRINILILLCFFEQTLSHADCGAHVAGLQRVIDAALGGGGGVPAARPSLVMSPAGRLAHRGLSQCCSFAASDVLRTCAVRNFGQFVGTASRLASKVFDACASHRAGLARRSGLSSPSCVAASAA